MRLCLTVCTLWLTYLALAKADNLKKVVCYFGSWAVYRIGNGNIQISDIDPTLCTHLIYTFVGINTAGEVNVLDPWSDLPEGGGKDGFSKFNALRAQSPGTKTLVAVGGWNEGSIKYSAVAADATLRAKFVNNVVDFVLTYGFDGFDVDWEYPAQRGGSSDDVQNYALLLKELREAFDQHGLILSAAVAAAETSASLSYDIPQISKYLDFINLMAYDYHGSWEKAAGHNAPLYAAERQKSAADLCLNINATVHYWLRQGAPPEKLILGTGFYGRSFTLSSAVKSAAGSPASGPGTPGPYTQESGMLGYNEICEYEMQGDWTISWDDEQHVVYAQLGNQWVSYDDVRSITEKAEFAKALGLGGAMVWSIETDDFRGVCGKKFPLLNALNAVLREGVASSSDSDSTAAESPSSDESQGDDVADLVPEPEEIAEPSADAEASDFPENPESENEVEEGPICTEAGYFRDSQDCTKFWCCLPIANGYTAKSFKCPSGLYFDPTTEACNYANLVEC